MKRSINILSLIPFLIILSCTPDLPEGPSVNKIFSLDGSIYETDLDYPYFYVAAYTDGFWRIDLSSDEHTAIELALLDSSQNITQANYIDAHGNEVIALTENNVWRSISYGNVWYRSEIGIDQIFYPQALSRSPFNPSKLFLVNQGDAMYSSSNWGESWKKGTESGSSGYYYSYWDPFRPGDIWLEGMLSIGEQFIVCVENYGASEREVNVPQYNEIAWFTSMWFDSTSIYMRMGDSNGRYVMKSDDGGYSWDEMTTGIPDTSRINSIFQNPIQPSTLYLTNNYHDIIYCSTDTLRSIFEIVRFEFANERESIIKIYYEPALNSLIVVTLYGIYEVSLDEIE